MSAPPPSWGIDYKPYEPKSTKLDKISINIMHIVNTRLGEIKLVGKFVKAQMR